MAEKEPSPEQIKYNISLWKWFPLGQIDAAWNLIEHISHMTSNKHPEEVEAVFAALQKLDDKIRADRYPFPNKKVKLSNGILLPKSSRRRTR